MIEMTFRDYIDGLVAVSSLSATIVAWNVHKHNIPGLKVEASSKCVISKDGVSEAFNTLDITNVSNLKISYHPSVEIKYNYSSPYALIEENSSVLLIDKHLLCADLRKEDDYSLSPGESRSYLVWIPKGEDIANRLFSGCKLKLGTKSLSKSFKSNDLSCWREDKELDTNLWLKKMFDIYFGTHAYKREELLISVEGNPIKSIDRINKYYKQRWMRKFVMEEFLTEHFS